MTTLVAHEPPLIPVLPDARAADRARAGVRDVYEAKGWGAGMAAEDRLQAVDEGAPVDALARGVARDPDRADAAGQMSASVAIDLFGLFGVPRQPLTAGIVAGSVAVPAAAA